MEIMLKHFLKPFNNNFLKKGFCTATVQEKWDLITAVCLERKPIITPPLNDLEKKFHRLLSEVEYERSFKSDHELKHEQDLKQQELLKQGKLDVDITIKDTAQDFLDTCTEELSRFKFGSRITDADKSNNLKSLNRKLDKHLVLLVKQKLGKNDEFLLPQSTRQDGETLRQTANRILQEICGPNVKAQFYGNAPSGFYKYKYRKSLQKENNKVGAKIFIYFAKHCSGQLAENGKEFKWLDRTELSKELNTNYYNSIAQFLIDERQ